MLKPLGAVEHQGGKKILPGDQGYRAIRGWLEDYARVVRDQYATAAALPQEVATQRFSTEVWLKVINTPAAWGDRLLQADVHAWDAQQKTWEPQPIASSDRQIHARLRLWQHTLTLAAPRDSQRANQWTKNAPALLPGRYLVKFYVDAAGQQRDWHLPLGPRNYVGQVEVNARWKPGYGSMTVADAAKLQK